MLESELNQKEREYAELDEEWKAEKASLTGTQNIKADLEQARIALEQARRTGNLAEMSELQYGKIPELEKQLAAATQAEGKSMKMLRNRVTDTEIADVLARWTGIPVARMLEGSVTNCCGWKRHCMIVLSARMKPSKRSLMLSAVVARGWRIPTVRWGLSCSLGRPG